MNITTKYGIGTSVVAIQRRSVELPPVTCTACEGSGRCDLRGESFACPKCSGRKETKANGTGWVIADYGVIGIVSGTAHVPTEDNLYDSDDPERDAEHGIEVTYMFGSSGSGSRYKEHMLWPSREEAQAECDRRNYYTARKAAAS